METDTSSPLPPDADAGGGLDFSFRTLTSSSGASILLSSPAGLRHIKNGSFRVPTVAQNDKLEFGHSTLHATAHFRSATMLHAPKYNYELIIAAAEDGTAATEGGSSTAGATMEPTTSTPESEGDDDGDNVWLIAGPVIVAVVVVLVAAGIGAFLYYRYERWMCGEGELAIS